MPRLPASLTCLTLAVALGCTPPKRADRGDGSGASPTVERSEADEPQPGAAPPPSAAPPSTLPELPIPALPSEVLEPAADGFALLEPGAEPRVPLRFTPVAGTRERVELIMTMSVGISGAGLPPMNQRLPPVSQINRVETLAVADERITEKIVFESITVDDTGVDPSRARAMQAAMEQITGFEQILVFDDRGGVLEGDMTIPEGVSEQLARTLETVGKTFEQAMVRLPADAVGVGGRWRETNELDSNGLALEQTSEFVLVAREDRRVTIETQITQRPLTTTFKPPDLETELEVVEFDSKGAGRIVYELDTLMPIELATMIDTTITAEARTSGPAQRVTFAMQIQLQMRPAPD